MTQETHSTTTVCQPLTGRGRSAIAVVEVCGPEARWAVEQCVRFSSDRELRIGEIRYGHWISVRDPGLDCGESVVISLTVDDVVEVHCHGGSAAVARLIEDLQHLGLRLASPQERRTGGAGTLLQHEATEALSRCTTVRTAAIALDQVRGAMLQWAENWRQRLEPAQRDPNVWQQLQPEWLEQTERICQAARTGLRLGLPYRVVLLGPPNVGKSTLMNQLLGWDRSITYNEPGTTRDVLHGSTVLDGLPIQFSDTAGIRVSDQPIEQEGIRRSQRELESADVVVVIRDPDTDPSETARIVERCDPRRLIRIFNKADQLGSQSRRSLDQDPAALATIATTGAGVDELKLRIVATLAMGLPQAASPVPVNERQWQAMQRLRNAASADDAIAGLQSLRGE